MSVCPPLRAEASPSVSFFFDFENRGQNKMLLGIFLGGGAEDMGYIYLAR